MSSSSVSDQILFILQDLAQMRSPPKKFPILPRRNLSLSFLLIFDLCALLTVIIALYLVG